MGIIAWREDCLVGNAPRALKCVVGCAADDGSLSGGRVSVPCGFGQEIARVNEDVGVRCGDGGDC